MKKLLLIVVVLAAGLLVPLGTVPPSHTVVRGDTLGQLADRYAVSVGELRSWNGLGGDLIEVGQVLALGPAGRESLGRQLWGRVRTPAPTPSAEPIVEAPTKRVEPRVARPRRTLGVDAQAAPWPALHRPRAKTCLSADTVAGTGMARSVGLEQEQISAAVRKHQQQALRCSEGSSAAGTVWLDITVGCDGRVLRSSPERDETGNPEFAACVADVFTYAAFPAHARDEVQFTVPLRFTAP